MYQPSPPRLSGLLGDGGGAERLDGVLHAVADPDAALALARYHLRLARRFRARAAELRARAERPKPVEWWNRANQLPARDRAAELLARGEGQESAAQILCAEYGGSMDSWRRYYATRAKEALRLKLKARNIEIVRQAARGRTNTEIAAAFGLKPKNISKIVQRALRTA